MNLSEFKAWFEGFTENLDGSPNEKQWNRITEKIGKIADAPAVTHTYFHDYYYRPWRRHYDCGPVWMAASQANSIGVSPAALGERFVAYSNAANSYQGLAAADDGATQIKFDSATAFKELGRAEMRSMMK